MRIVVKLGTRVLLGPEGGLNEQHLLSLLEGVQSLCDAGHHCLLVTSGAIALGLPAVGLERRTADSARVRAASCIGQLQLSASLARICGKLGIQAGQLLITRSDMEEREQFLVLRDTLEELLQRNVLPILNENDVVSVNRTGFRDNDHLAALAAIVLRADLVLFLSSTDGLWRYKDGKPIEKIHSLSGVDNESFDLVQKKQDALSTGGMQSKLLSARLALAGGARCIIADGKDPSLFQKFLKGEPLGTKITADPSLPPQEFSQRKLWLAFFRRPAGEITIDEGAVQALQSKGKSLLAVGVRNCVGEFTAESVIRVLTLEGTVIAHGLIRCSSEELNRIISNPERLREERGNVVVHRDNMVVFR